MRQHELKTLLKKYLAGTATPEEREAVDRWYNSLSLNDEKKKLGEHQRQALRARYWNFLQQKIRPAPAAGTRHLWFQIPAIAAAILAVVLIVYLVLPSLNVSKTSQTAHQPAADPTVIRNETADARIILLSDHSRVTLSPGTTMTVESNFNTADRKVTLSGEAFFEIARNENKPFYVFSNEVVTRVLGTSFTVTAYPGDPEITVAVKSGKVSVSAGAEYTGVSSKSQEVILVHNQQAIYKKDAGTVLRTLVEEPEVVIADEEVKKMRFEGVPASEIFHALERMYGVEIKFEERDFAKCLVTTSVSGHDLYERIDVICEITGATYEIVDTEIHIAGSGCN